MNRFVFGAFSMIDRFNAGELTAMQRKQLLVAGKNACDRTALDDIFTASEEEDMFWEHAAVTDGAEGAAHDAWLLGAQNGTIFDAGTTNESGIVMIDGEFIAEKKAITAAVCRALKTAYVAARPPFDDWMAAYEAHMAEFRKKERGAAGSKATVAKKTPGPKKRAARSKVARKAPKKISLRKQK